MSPVVMRNRMRTRSASRADAADSSPMKKSSSRSQRPRRKSQVDDDIMTKSELARTIAEFRVGYFPSQESNHSHSGDTEAVTKDTDVDEKMADAQKNELAPIGDQSQPTKFPFTKARSYEANEKPPGNITQTSTTATTIPLSQNLQTSQTDENGIASLEDPPVSLSTGHHRRGFSSSERELLEAAFHIADNPGTATMKLLVHLTGLDKKKIRGWFRTRRIRQEREEAKLDSSEETPSVSEPKHQVPPQYWPEPLRFSHMQRSYPIPGYNSRAPSGVQPMMTPSIPPMMTPGIQPMTPGSPPMTLGIPPMIPGIPPMIPGIPSLPSKIPTTPWYPPPPTMGFLPPQPGHWYPPFSFNASLPPHSKDGPLSSGLPSASQGTPSVAAPKVPSGPLYPSPTTGHPLQGVIPQSASTSNVPSGLLPGGFLHPWSSVGCHPAPGVIPQHPGTTPYPSHLAQSYCSPWYPMLPAPNAQSPAGRQSKAEATEINAASTSQTDKSLPSQVTIQEVSETESEAASTA